MPRKGESGRYGTPRGGNDANWVYEGGGGGLKCLSAAVWKYEKSVLARTVLLGAEGMGGGNRAKST